ncbi:fructose-2,6-bisphosphatase [Desulfocurvibacter africanus PCS]|uniref:Fructose-2,6-bisphosphatase n=1 Tax=Desulfocurvibacter africanus PCS TaxID=1262666 RepID=M5PXW3_DESAF|nr:histidine phosphatase family protein [Desulfocurvibacter africanus]EMG38884.1 fructose-2,6-bisphosphatase [Desulfocurvibacter africanus PCS]
MTANTAIFLARHGQVIQNSPRRFIGQRDVPLDKVGRLQAETLAQALANTHLDGIWASDLSRAMDTAKPTAAGREITAVPELREICLGDWEDLTSDEVRARFPGEYERRGADFAEYRPVGGESFRDVQKRALPALERIADLRGRHLVVAHGGVNRALLCAILGLPLAQLMRLEQDYCHVNVLLRAPSGWRLLGLNIPPCGPFPLPLR